MMNRSRIVILFLGSLIAPALSCDLVSDTEPLMTPAAIPTSTSTIAPSPTGTSTPRPTITLTPTPTTLPTPGPIGPFVPVTLGEDRPPGSLRDWRIAPDGTLWLTTDLALASLKQGIWTIHPIYGDVLLGFDDAGRAWTAFEDGASIAAWDGQAWTVYGPQSGWSSAGPVRRHEPFATVGEEIVTDDRGRIWIVTQNDVRVLDDDQWTIFTPEGAGFTPSPEMVQEGFGYWLRDIARDSVGDVWVTDCAWMGPGPMGRGARWYTGNQWQGDKTEEVSSGCIEDIEVDTSGRIWMGVDADLVSYTPGEGWENLGHPEFNPEWGLRWGWISNITLGADGSAWLYYSPCGGASCDTGLSILFALRDGEWIFVSDRGPFDLALDDSGDGWLCTADGLYRIAGESVESLYQQDAFQCGLDADSTGQIWLSFSGQSSFWLYVDQGGG